MIYSTKAPIMTHQPGLPADSASCKKPGGSPKPSLNSNPRAYLSRVDENEIPNVGELVFSWSIHKKEWIPYEVLESKTKLCPIAMQPKWCLIKIETGLQLHLLARNLYRAKI